MESAETLPSALVRLFGAGRGLTFSSGGALNNPDDSTNTFYLFH